jgi:hypothetical protein
MHIPCQRDFFRGRPWKSYFRWKKFPQQFGHSAGEEKIIHFARPLPIQGITLHFANR